MAKRNKIKSARPLLKLEALEQRQLLAGGFTTAQGTEFSNIVHANGNVYDQVLLKSSAITISNDAGQITRVSFLDLQGDIVQAEFSGAGQLSISLDNYSGPAEATKYAQPGVQYVSGLASFTIQGSDSTTNFSVFSVGSSTANAGKDNPIFAGGLTGGNNTADVARLTVVANPANPNGSTFGGIRAGNAVFGGSEGPVGISAANVQVQNVVTVGDLNASGTATPTLIFGTQSQFGAVSVAGGDLVSDNGKSVNNTGSYAFGVNLTAGTTSGGTTIAAADATAAGSFTGSNPFNATANSFTLTTGVDTIPGLSGTAGTGNGGNDTINGTIGGGSPTLTALDSINGGKGTDTLVLLDLGNNTAIPGGVTLSSVETVNFRSAGGATIDTSSQADVTTLNVTQGTSATVTGAKTTAINISGITGAVVADGGSMLTISTEAGDVTVGGTTAPAGAISVTDSKQAGTDVVIHGGTNVSVTTTGAGAGGTINVGATTQPSGMITINSTGAAYDATAASLSLGGITTKGGTSVTVTQTAASSSADAATDLTAATITQSAVSITGTKATTSVSVTQSAPVNQVNYVAAAGSKEVSELTFAAMVANDTTTIEGLTFTAAKALTAEQAAAAFANLAASATQGTSPVSNGVYSGVLSASFVSGAASATKVTFTGASNGNLNIAVTAGIVDPTISANTDGASTVTTTAGVMGVAGGMVAVADSTDKTIATVSLSGYGAKERVVVTLAGAPVNGDTLIFDGVTTTYVDVTPTLAELITAAAGKTYTNWIVSSSNATTITFEAKNSTNVADTVTGDFTGTAGALVTGAVVTVQGSGNSTVSSDALTSLSLSRSNADVAVTNATATTLGLTVNAVGTSTSNAGGVSLGGTYTTVNLNSAGASWLALSGAGVTNLNVSGSAVTNVGSTVTGETSSLGALTTVTVTGSAGLTLGTNGSTTITSIDASGTSGAVSSSLIGNVGTFTGGSGADTVTLTGGTVSKAISTGAGNDTVNLFAGTTTLGAVINAGDGTDTLKFGAVADAVTASGTATFADSITGFEKISLIAGAGAQEVKLNNLDAINYVISAGSTGALTLSGMAANSTLELNAAAAGTTEVVLTDATGTADTLNVITTNSGTVNLGTVIAAGVETIKLTATDTTTSTVDTHTLNIKAADATTLTLAGTAKLTLTFDAATAKLSMIDGSALTTALTVTGNTSVAQTIKGGTAADSLTAGYQGDTLQGGAGADTLNANGKSLVTLTGGTGADSFNVSTATTNVNSYATITDLESTDKITFGVVGAPTFKAAAITLDPTTAVFQDYANAAVAGSAYGAVSWFQYNGNTYVVQDAGAGDSASSFVNTEDVIVKISGLKDLSTASFNSTSATLLIV